MDRAAHAAVAPNIEFMISGVALALLGLWLRFAAIRSLGAFFAAELKVLTIQPLVVHGPYRHIRHPSYSGLLLILTGISLILATGWGLLFLAAVMVPAVLLRTMLEERMLVDGFGEAYRAYRTRTHRLIPAIF